MKRNFFKFKVLLFTLLFAFLFPKLLLAEILWPTKDKTVTACFCSSPSCTYYHIGIDIRVPQGGSVWSIAPGKVVYVEKDCKEHPLNITCAEGDPECPTKCGRGYGNFVVLYHEDLGIYSLYAHFKEVNVKVGDVVSQGQELGKIGLTGRTTGPHLHFEIQKNGVRLDPLRYFKDGWSNAEGPESDWCTPEYYRGEIPPEKWKRCDSPRIQRIYQFKCENLEPCSGPIIVKERLAERVCTSTGAAIVCTPWKFKEEREVYRGRPAPWLICTYNYDNLTPEERERAGVKRTMVTCTDQDCGFEEVDWFPVVKNEDSCEYFENKIRGKDFRFFEIAQLTCWGGCIQSQNYPPIEYPYYFGGSINPARTIAPGREEGENQSPDAVRLPVKFGWEFDDKAWGMDDWKGAIKIAKQECYKKKIAGGRCYDYLYEYYPEGETEPVYAPPDEKIAKGVLERHVYGENHFKIKVNSSAGTYLLEWGLGVGSFKFRLDNGKIDRFLPITEGQKIPNWQTPAPDWQTFEWPPPWWDPQYHPKVEPDPDTWQTGEWQTPVPLEGAYRKVGDEKKLAKRDFRRDMYDYFDYYFLSDTSYSATDFRYGFPGYHYKRYREYYLYVYSPTQDTKSDYLWIEYRPPKPPLLTQLRLPKNQPTYGPCTIEPFTYHTWEVQACCGVNPMNCSPQKRTWRFKALGPEIKSILGIRVDEVKTVYPFHISDLPLRTIDPVIGIPPQAGRTNKLEGKIYRFVDIDWDRTWPSKTKREEILARQKGSKVLTDYFYVGALNFAQFDGGERDECEKECKRKCDAECLSGCETQCIEECNIAAQKAYKECGGGDAGYVCRVRVNQNLAACKELCAKNFLKYREGCKECKGEERDLGCITCRSCEEKYPCTKKCVEDCYKRKIEEKKIQVKEEIEDCDKVCAELDEKTRFTAINHECYLIPTKYEWGQKLQKKCRACQNCKYKVDFVDVEWCTNIEPGWGAVSNVYKERYDTNFPLEKFWQETYPKECEKVDTSPFCQGEQKCQCFRYSSKGEEILAHDNCQKKLIDTFFFNPSLRRGAEVKFTCKLFPSEKETECPAFLQFQAHGSASGAYNQRLKVTTDVYEQFGGIKKGEEIYQIPISLYDEKPTKKLYFSEWDISSLWFNSLVPNGVIVGKCQRGQCLGSSLRWDFVLNTLPKTQLCNFGWKNCFGERENEYPFCWKISWERIKSQNSGEHPVETKEGESIKGLNRLESFSLGAERIFSFRLKVREVKEGFSPYLEYLPKAPTHSPIYTYPRDLPPPGIKKGITFSAWEFWNDLPPFGNALKRLNKEFIFEFYPCGDETGFFCSGTPIQQKVKITGEKNPFPFKEEFSSPPPPKKVRIPREFDWDPTLGAASYWLKFDGESTTTKIFFPALQRALPSREKVELKEEGKYTWQIKTCADLCQKEDPSLLQCGDWGKPMKFEAYFLSPPTKFKLPPNAQFLPNELEHSVILEWEPVATGTDCTHLVVRYLKPSLDEKREDCIEKARSGYVLVDEIMEGKVTQYKIPFEKFPTSAKEMEIKIDGEKISTKVCLGSYGYQVRYCTGKSCAKPVESCLPLEKCLEWFGKDDERYIDCLDCLYSANCKEAGDFSTLRYFEIVSKKGKVEEGGIPGFIKRGFGFGTCQKIVPCGGGEPCQLSHIPKLIANILSCILWTISPIACIFLLVYTGIGLYFSLGKPELVAEILPFPAFDLKTAKEIWKAVGFGWLIMLFSWTIVNLIGKTFKMPGW